MAPQTGALKASPIPSAKMQASTAPGLITSVHAPKARSAEQAPCHSTALYNHSAPVHDVSNRAGRQREEKKWRGGSGGHQGKRRTTKRQGHASTKSRSRLGRRRTCPTTRSPAINGKTRGSEVRTKLKLIYFPLQADEKFGPQVAIRICSRCRASPESWLPADRKRLLSKASPSSRDF